MRILLPAPKHFVAPKAEQPLTMHIKVSGGSTILKVLGGKSLGNEILNKVSGRFLGFN